MPSANEGFYRNAADRAAAAEAFIGEAVRGAVILNGAAAGLTIHSALDAGGRCDATHLHDAVSLLARGAAIGVVAVVLYGGALLCRSHYEFQDAETRAGAGGSNSEQQRRRWKGLWVALFLGMLLAGTASILHFVQGARQAVEGCATATKTS